VTPEQSTIRALWPAPVAAGAVDATVRVPGSKSITNRALVLAAIADSPTLVQQPLVSRDTELMAGALRALGVAVTDEAGDWRITPTPLRGPAHVDVGLAGTVMRFVPPVAALADGPVTFDGDARSRERPLRPLIDALRSLGADIDDGGRGALPLAIRGQGRLRGGTVDIDASASSQLLSALLLTAPRYDEGVRVRHVGGRLPSAPFIDLTVAMLRDRGASVDVGDGTWTVKPGTVSGGEVVVEPDLSSAAPFLVAPLVAGGSLRLQGWPRESLQAGASTPQVLEAMGARCRHVGTALEVTGEGSISGVDVDLADNPELACVLAAVAALATTPSRLRGIGHMRGHETDRLAALARELGGLGARVVEHEDGLEIQPSDLHGGTFHTYDDHRLAMAAAVLGLVVPQVLVENVATTAKTYPGFAEQWQSVVDGDSR
jgi:3-phosphoshikimate 1-carboxyvinyltransferase